MQEGPQMTNRTQGSSRAIGVASDPPQKDPKRISKGKVPQERPKVCGGVGERVCAKCGGIGWLWLEHSV